MSCLSMCRSSDISFQLPPIAKLRHTSSLDAMDLLDSDDQQSDQRSGQQSPSRSHDSSLTATSKDSALSAASPLSSHSKRSNSFSEFTASPHGQSLTL